MSHLTYHIIRVPRGGGGGVWGVQTTPFKFEWKTGIRGVQTPPFDVVFFYIFIFFLLEWERLVMYEDTPTLCLENWPSNHHTYSLSEQHIKLLLTQHMFNVVCSHLPALNRVVNFLLQSIQWGASWSGTHTGLSAVAGFFPPGWKKEF